MAYISRRVSDISGTEAAEDQFIELVIREHPTTDRPKKLDVLPDEIKGLKSAGEIVVIEVGANGDKKQLVVSLADFRKLVSDEVVKNAQGTRGGRSGWRPNG